MVRKAFSMIELVFAIVVVAITVISLPMLRDITSTSNVQNLTIDEAVFEAYVKAIEVTDQKFEDVQDQQKTSVIGSGEAGTLEGLKFDNTYEVKVRNPASFGKDLNSDDIKKVTLTIYNDKDEIVTRLYTYKFNF